jgi:hypothetical protein
VYVCVCVCVCARAGGGGTLTSGHVKEAGTLLANAGISIFLFAVGADSAGICLSLQTPPKLDRIQNPK